MDEPVKKRVDESWKEQVDREKQTPAAGGTPPPAGAGPAQETAEPSRPEGALAEVRFDLFLSGLAMEAFVALGDMPHPTTRRQAANLTQAKYLIDLLGVLEEKTKGNLTVDEEKLLRDALYQLRMRYLAKAGANR